MPVTRTSLNPDEVSSRCLLWNDSEPICWSNNPYTWNDVCLIIELISGGAYSDEAAVQVYEDWTETKKKQFITLYLKVKEQNADIYKDVGDSTVEVKNDIIITAKEIRLVAETVLKPNVTLLTEIKNV